MGRLWWVGEVVKHCDCRERRRAVARGRSFMVIVAEDSERTDREQSDR
jgi:hypothetical protein